MKDIFTDLYKKLAGFFQATEEKKDATKDVACNRLKFVLMQDRTNLTPYLLERMRGEMVDVLSKYVEMDRDALELSFEQEGESMALMLSIPVIRAKDEEEIQAIIAEEEKVKREKAEQEAAEKAENEEESNESEEEAQEEIEESFEDDSTETVDAESEEAEDEEVCTCGEGDDYDDEDDCDGGCQCGEESECSCQKTSESVVDEKTSKKKNKK